MIVLQRRQFPNSPAKKAAKLAVNLRAAPPLPPSNPIPLAPARDGTSVPRVKHQLGRDGQCTNIPSNLMSSVSSFVGSPGWSQVSSNAPTPGQKPNSQYYTVEQDLNSSSDSEQNLSFHFQMTQLKSI